MRVVSVPLPYGAFPARGSRSRALFLQTALWNIARLRFLRDARAVLPCDVDELVTRQRRAQRVRRGGGVLAAAT